MGEPKNIICIVGRTGSGKDTLVNELMSNFKYIKDNFKTIVSYTTRPKRYEEINYIHHIFVNDEEFDKVQKEKKIIAYTKIGDYRYMATYEDLSRFNFYIIDPEGIKSLRNFIKAQNLNINLFVIYINTVYNVRSKRCRKRSDYITHFVKRNNEESEQFDRFERESKYDFKVNNNSDDLRATTLLLYNLVRGFCFCISIEKFFYNIFNKKYITLSNFSK